ncbi:SICA antigen [Plasmodium coatneyi]|uniref:SICA antigen n=1 Tax=Plasmodium coatneyi TaxID=208452 RepID=A0A1B1E037_9APIC|nr:SICA antigen [Plasmodium coatneyi]ANQ08392.1 SICA antigen [Plasmodium coatneyi]
MIIDIHLEVLNECEKGDLHSTKEDFFEILVQEFMGSELIKEEKVPSSDSGLQGLGKKASFLRMRFLWKMFLRKKFQVQIPCLELMLLRKRFLGKRFQVQIPGFRV